MIDFSVAKTDDAADLTEAGDLLGTVRYLAPEAFEGKADHRADVYALGLTLYELLALRPAYDGADRARVMRAVLEARPKPLRTLGGGLPRRAGRPVGAVRDRAGDGPGLRRRLCEGRGGSPAGVITTPCPATPT